MRIERRRRLGSNTVHVYNTYRCNVGRCASEIDMWRQLNRLVYYEKKHFFNYRFREYQST